MLVEDDLTMGNQVVRSKTTLRASVQPGRSFGLRPAHSSAVAPSCGSAYPPPSRGCSRGRQFRSGDRLRLQKQRVVDGLQDAACQAGWRNP